MLQPFAKVSCPFVKFLVLLSRFFFYWCNLFVKGAAARKSFCLLSRLGRLLSSLLVLDAFAKPAWTTIGSALLSRVFLLEDVNGCSCKVREAALELRLPLFPSLTSRHNGVSLDAKLNGFRTNFSIVIHQLAYPIVQAPLGFPFLATLLPGEADRGPAIPFKPGPVIHLMASLPATVAQQVHFIPCILELLQPWGGCEVIQVVMHQDLVPVHCNPLGWLLFWQALFAIIPFCQGVRAAR